MKERVEEKERGQSLVELAILLPVLLIILAGVLDLGRLFFAYVAVTDAAAEGVTYAASYPPAGSETCPAAPDCDTAGSLDCLCERVVGASGGFVQIEASAIDVTCPTCPGYHSGDSITVTVTYSFTLITPFLNIIVPGGVLPLRAVATEAILSGSVP